MSTILIVESRFGATDCSGCRIFRQGRQIFAKPTQQPGENSSANFISLPIKIADLPSVEAAEEALKRIEYAIKASETFVDLTDLDNIIQSEN